MNTKSQGGVSRITRVIAIVETRGMHKGSLAPPRSNLLPLVCLDLNIIVIVKYLPPILCFLNYDVVTEKN